MNLTDYIKEWFLAIDKDQQNFIASFTLTFSPLNQDKEKAQKDPEKNFVSLLDSHTNLTDEIGLCLGLITTIDFILRKFDDVNNALDRYNDIKEIKSKFESKGMPTELEEELLNEAPERFEKQKFAKETWDILKEKKLNIDEIYNYYALKTIEGMRGR